MRAVRRKRRIRNPDAPQLPHEAVYLWHAFVSLHGTRSIGFSAPNPISYTEMDAWCRLSGLRLTGYDLDVMRALDGVYMDIATADLNKNPQQPPRKPEAPPHGRR